MCVYKYIYILLFSHSVVSNFVTPWATACQAFLSFSQNLLKLMSTESVMPSNQLILCHPLLLLPSVFPIIRFFSNESVLRIRWPKYWSFSFSSSPSHEYLGLISFRIHWFDHLVPLESLLQPQFENTNSSALSLFYSPALKSVHDYWKNHSSDYI